MEEGSFGADHADVDLDRELNADQCSSLFPNPAELKNTQSPKEERLYKCNQCDKSYRHAGSLVNHKKTHQIGLYACLICQKEFSNPMGLKCHLRTHSEDKRFKCDQCGEAFRMSQQLYNHRRSSHGFSSVSNAESIGRSHKGDVQAPLLADSGNLISNLENYIAESMVPGDFSQVVSKYYQDENSPTEEPAKDDIVTQQGSMEETREDQPPNDNTEEYRYKCNQCGKAYKHAGSLANHRQSHMVGLYQCAICFKEFSNLMAMKNHCRLHSDSRQRSKSPRYSAIIGASLLEPTDTLQSDLLHSNDTTEKHEDLPAVLQVSESSNHEEEKEKLPSPVQKLQDLHSDSFCSEQAFQSSSNDSMVQVDENTVDPNSILTSEETSQQSEQQQCDETLEEEDKPGDLENRPFRCQECGKTYRHAGSLINHKKTHQTGVYACPVCSKQMFNVAALNNHFRAHFKARAGRKVEDYYFPSASFPELFHSPEDPFQCRTCGECLPNESEFLQHQVIHQEEAIKETYSDTQNIEEALKSDSHWPEHPQVSQNTSDISGPIMQNSVKQELAELAEQQTLHQWTHEETSATPLEGTPQNNVGIMQDTSNDIVQHSLDQTVYKQESPQLEEHDESPADRPYGCELCGRTYRHRSSLINHKLTHKTGIYPCSICPKQYSNLMALRNHLRFHSRSYTGRRGILSRRERDYFYGRHRFLQNKTVNSVSESLKSNKSISPQTDTIDTAVEGTSISTSCGESFDCTESFQCHSQTCEKSTPVSSPVEPPIDPKKEHIPSDPQDNNKNTEKVESPVKVLEASEFQDRRIYECDLCNKSYRHSGSLINHKRTHQTGDYMCPYCSRHVHNMAALKNHIRIHHKIKNRHLGEMQDSSRFLYPDLSYPHSGAKHLYGCVSCEEIFHSEDDLVAHQMVHMALEGDPSDQTVQESNIADEAKNRSFENVSDSEWEQSNNADIHGSEHDESRELVSEDYSNHIDYTCIECGEVYTSIEELNNHKLTHQIGIYQCSFCPKEYPSLQALRDHFQSHTKPHALRNVKDHFDGTEPNDIVQDQLNFNSYDCGHCGLVFSNEVDFHQHQVAHEKQVKAESIPVLGPEGKETEYSFPMDSSERELLRRIKSELEEADHTEAPDGSSQLSHICGYCGQTYDDIESLQVHSLSHGPEENSLPNESISSDLNIQENNLQRTAKVEDENSDEMAKNDESQEDRPYTCNQCGKSYRHGGSLVNHKKTHLVGNFQCMACSKQYPNMAAYINHLRHHPECKQQAAMNSQQDSTASALHDLPSTTGEVGHLNISPSANPSTSNVLPCDFKPCVDTLSIDESCFVHSTTQVNFQTPENPTKLSGKCSRQGKGRNDSLNSPPFEGGNISVTCGSDVDDGLLQIHEYSSKTFFGVKSLHISGNCKRNGELEIVAHTEDNTKDQIPLLACLSHNQSEVEDPYHGQTCEDLESKHGHSLSHVAEEKPLENESVNDQAGNLQKIPVVKEERFDQTSKNDESQENRPYACNQCGKSYRYGGSLVNHKKTHVVGNFQCVACFKQYPNMSSYINHLRHYPKCKQQINMNSQLDANVSDIHGSTGEEGHLNFSPSAPLPDPFASKVLPSEFKPCIDTLSLDNSCLDHSNTQTNFNTLENNSKLSWEQCLRQDEKTHDAVTSPSFKSECTSVACVSDVDDKSIQTCQVSGKTLFGVKALSLHFAGNSEKSCAMELVSHSEETIKCEEEEEILALANSSPYRNDVEGSFHQRPFRCEVCGRSYRHAGSLINHKQTHKTGVFRCSICQKGFFNLMAMKNHNRIHFELKRHKCLDCGKAFRLRKQLDTHQRLHWQRAAVRKSGRRNRLSTKSRKFAQTLQLKATSLCEDVALDQSDCSAKKSTDSFVKREQDPDSRPYQCEECGRSYRHAGSLFNHKKSHKMGQYGCSICHKTYSNLMALKNHERNHYEAKRHHCLHCGKTFKWKRQLTRHQFVHSQEESQSGSQTLTGERKPSTSNDHQAERSTGFFKRSRKSSNQFFTSLKKRRGYFGNHAQSHAQSTKEAVCKACGDVFSSSDELRIHVCSKSRMKINPGSNEVEKPTLSKEDTERPYGCDICGRTYRHAGSLLNHKNTHKKGLYKCSLCNKQFFNPMAIKNHLRTHTAKKEFQCMECGKAFRSSRDLVCHIRVHTGVRPFHCPTCNREFSSKLTLKHHQRTHKKSKSFQSSSPRVQSDEETKMYENTLEPNQVSPPTQERKYKCNQCDRSYRHASSLFNHKKTHRTGVYKCSDCLKEFFNLMAYNNHLRIHKYPCKDCGKAFRIAGHLEAHRKVHEQEGNLACSLCDKLFSSRSSFEHHQLTHHGSSNDVLDQQPVSKLMVEVT